MSISPLVFTGVSSFSDDLQTILSRTVQIASIPVAQLQNEQVDLLTKKELLTGLKTVVDDLATKVNSLATLGETRALSVSSTNANRVSVSMNGATEAGTYTISDITSVASAASENTLTGYETSDATAVSADGTMELVVGAETYEVDLTGDYGNTLEGLRDSINALGAGVSATILNTGSGATPYYLSITAQDSGATTLELRETAGDSETNILTGDNQGSDAVFKLNGLDVTRSQNTINDALSGVSFKIVSTTSEGESVEIKLSSSQTAVGSAINSLVSAYNTARAQVTTQVGEEAGLLSGDFIVREIQSRMRGLAGYTANSDGAVQNLADLGIEFDGYGEMSFDSSKFYSLSQSQFSDALEFLGSSTSGLGLVADSLETITAPVTGLIATQQDQYDVADERINSQIEAMTARIEYMQQSTSLNLQLADALLAQLEGQQTILAGSIDAFYLTLYGRNDK